MAHRLQALSRQLTSAPFSTERLHNMNHRLPLLSASSSSFLSTSPTASSALPEHPEDSEERSSSPSANMSTQAPHPTLLIPGPIEFDDAVLQSMSHYA